MASFTQKWYHDCNHANGFGYEYRLWLRYGCNCDDDSIHRQLTVPPDCCGRRWWHPHLHLRGWRWHSHIPVEQRWPHAIVRRCLSPPLQHQHSGVACAIIHPTSMANGLFARLGCPLWWFYCVTFYEKCITYPFFRKLIYCFWKKLT